MFRRKVGIVILALGLACIPAGAQAFSIFGMTFFEDEDTSVIADPQPYTVEVIATGANDEAKSSAELASELWKGRETPASGMAGLLAQARGDYRRILSALYENGLYGATVSIRINGAEAGDLAPDATITANPQVIISIDSGPVFRFGDLSIENQPGPLPDTGNFKPGEVARPAAIRQAARSTLAEWRMRGFPKAEINNQSIVAQHQTSLVNVVLSVDPGREATIGAIDVQGAETIDPNFIIQQSGLQTGDRYDPDRMDMAKQRLIDLGVFQVVQISEDAPIGPDGALPITIVVKEKPPRRIGVGAVYSTTEGVGLETFWLHRNLFGQAERLRLDAKLSGIGFPLDTADFDYYFGGVFTKPGVIAPATDLTAELIAQRAVLERYTETSAEARVGFSHEILPELQATFGVAAKAGNFFDPIYFNRDFILTGLYGGLEYDTRDTPTDATEGIFAAIDVEPFYEWVYANPALLVTGEARAYYAFDPEAKFVVAGRLKLGALFGPSIAETPPDKLFFAGGGGSVRGYPYRGIGVQQPGGGVTGGTLLAEASLEARVKINETFGLVGFVDAGYVSDMSVLGFSEGTQFGAGVGLRYYTGLGPIRLDVAVPLNPRPGDPDYAIYAGIGQAF